LPAVPARRKTGSSASRRAPALVDVRVEHPQGGSQARRLRARAFSFLGALDLARVELSILLTTDEAIRGLNRAWRKKDSATDVLSFPAGEMPPEAPGRRPLGDVIISLDTARRQAREHRRTLGSELDRYLAHGLLHLLGHDHHRRAEARRMAELEDRLLGSSGMIRRSSRAR
jgi:probable rRNA maturation factor